MSSLHGDREVPPVLLTGGTGFIGNHLRAALQGYTVLLMSRSKPELWNNERWAYMDMAEPVEPKSLASGEVLCHLAYSRVAGRENVAHNVRLLAAVNACPSLRRVVLISTTSVYGINALQVVDDESPCNPVGEYAETKLACETVWRNGLREDCALTVLRPSEVIGPGGRGLISLIWDALDRPLVGAVKRSLLYHRPLHYVAVSNVVAAVLFCLQQPQGFGRQIYLVSDDHQPENKSYATMQDAVRKVVGRRPLPSVAVPLWALRTLGRLTGRPLSLNQVLDSQKIREAGFKDSVTLREEVERVVTSLQRSS